MRAFWIAALCVGLIGIPSPATADSEEEATAKARDHFQRGRALHDLAKYNEAIKEFEAAYQLRDDPVLLYNIAQAHRLAKRYSAAIRFYRTYLRRSPEAPNREDVEKKIADLEELLEKQGVVANAPPGDAIGPPAADPTVQPGDSSTPSEPVAPVDSSATSDGTSTATEETKPVEQAADTEEPSSSGGKKGVSPAMVKIIAGGAIALVGLGGIGMGVAFGLQAQSKADELNASPVFDKDLESQGQLAQTLQIVGLAAGGALVAVGAGLAAWGFVERKGDHGDSAARGSNLARARMPRVAPAIGPSFAGAVVRGKF